MYFSVIGIKNEPIIAGSTTFFLSLKVCEQDQ